LARPSSLSAVWSRDLDRGAGRLTAQVEAAYSDERSYSLDYDPRLVEPDYWLIDASTRYRFGKQERYEVALWGRNLGATTYSARRGDVGGIGVGNVINCQPNEGIRFFGLTVAARSDSRRRLIEIRPTIIARRVGRSWSNDSALLEENPFLMSAGRTYGRPRYMER